MFHPDTDSEMIPNGGVSLFEFLLEFEVSGIENHLCFVAEDLQIIPVTW